MTTHQIEKNIAQLLKDYSQNSFVFKFLLAYGEAKSSIARLQKGDLNQLESKGELTMRKKLFFKEAQSDLHSTIEKLKEESTQSKSKQKPRFIIVTDYKIVLAYDTKTTDTLDIKFEELLKHYDFFLPLAGMEKSTHIDENPADVKASNQLAKLYDEILKTNPTNSHEEVHALNVFLTRLLFCYFAEDSNIFTDNLFTNAVSTHTQVDGSDVDSYIERLFEIFNADDKDRASNLSDLPEYLKAFPYVNGGLFRDKYSIPKFTTKSRNILIEIGGLDWSEINPDIFGSMIQAVVTAEHRGDMGMHYTSVPNIMKVMQPLFLDELYEEFENIKTNKKKLQELINRISNLKIFDPACGSGNFLIIAYKELRRLEMKILAQIDTFSKQKSFVFSEIKLTQFYGIELDDFAHEVAILSLWLAEHQMNLEFYKVFGRTAPSLPLQDGGNIVHGNATRIDWESVCPKEDGNEIYVFGNPPYLGSRNQNKEQKEDMKAVFIKDYKSLDYIAAWFYLGANYIRGINAKCAFVSTNSISQGEQVALTWPRVLKDDLEICFAHQSFKWQNNAKANAGVTVVIIGLANISKSKKILYKDTIKVIVSNITPYLISGKSIYIYSKTKPLSNLPEINFGNMPADGGKLLFTPQEKDIFIEKEPQSKKWFKQLLSANEFLNGKERWCLWLEDINKDELYNSPIVFKRVKELKEIRLNSSRPQLAEIPHLFAQITQPKNKGFILIPKTSSENREYIPMGFFSSEKKSSDSCFTVCTDETYYLGILTSKMHMTWMKEIGGKLESRYRYSKNIVYNTFPFPNIADKQKEEITELVFNILDEREQHSEKTLAQLYDPDKMPQGLKDAHHQLDLAIEQCYRKKPFENDEERLEYLFKLYEEMIAKEKMGK